jgi:hypothetical protein
MNGAVPAKTTYKQWLKRQSKATQIKVLGKKRAELYRSGQVKIDRFVGKDFKPLTLKQLARREGIDLAPVSQKPVAGISKKIIRPISIKNNGIDITAEELNNGIDITAEELKMLEDYSWDKNSWNIVRAQLGKPSRKWWNFAGKKEALLQADKIETALKKLNGFEGTTYRGIRFNTSKQRQVFLDKFKAGTVWKGESFQSASKSKSVAESFMKEEAKYYASKNSIMMHIKSKSGRDLTNRMQEVLFVKGVPFKVTKIKIDEIWLEEL